MIPENIVDEVLTRADIVDLVGSYIQLKRRGSEYWGCCPFHKEKTPSFKVDSSRQTYYCFGCHTKGNACTFVMNYENLDFPGAIRYLAQKYGIHIPENNNPKEYKKSKKRLELKERLFALMEDAAIWFQKNLREAVGENARKYLNNRNLPIYEANKFGVGYAPPTWDAMLNWGKNNGYELQEMIQAGLIIHREPEDGKPEKIYDRFRNRLMFPIRNELGRTVAFSGRILTNSKKEAKYINSPESLIFNKGSVLYGLNIARKHFKELNHALICEGQLDVIACHRAGINNAIAPQGTAFTEEQAKLLKRFTNHIVFAFDADTAGQKATLRSIKIAMQLGIKTQIVEMPDGEDPDNIFSKKGADALKKQMQNCTDFLPYLLKIAYKKYDQDNPEDKADIAQMVLENIAIIPNPVTVAAACQWLAKQLSLPEQPLQQMFTEIKEKQNRQLQREEARKQKKEQNQYIQPQYIQTQNNHPPFPTSEYLEQEPIMTDMDEIYNYDEQFADPKINTNTQPFPTAIIRTQYNNKYNDKWKKKRTLFEYPNPNRPKNNLPINEYATLSLFDLAMNYEFIAHELVKKIPTQTISNTAIGQALTLVLALTEQGEWELIQDELNNHEEIIQNPEIATIINKSNFECQNPEKFPEHKQEIAKQRLQQAMYDCLKSIEINELKNKRNLLQDKLSNENDTNISMEILQQIVTITRQIDSLNYNSQNE